VRFVQPPPLATYLPNHGAPTRPEVLRIQLRLKAFHKFYLNRYVYLLARRFQELGLPRPPDEILNQTKPSNYALLVQYVLSEDKAACRSIRIFVVGETTVSAPLIMTVYSLLLFSF
jgi:hypothetical protein